MVAREERRRFLEWAWNVFTGYVPPSPKGKKIKYIEPTDQMIETFCKPLINAARKDKALRLRLSEQMNRVIGRQPMGDLCYKILIDEKPRITRFPRIAARIKRELGA